MAVAMLAALTSLLPGCRYEVVREPAWPVRLAGTLPKAVVIETLEPAAAVKATGSDHSSAPCAMVTDAAPRKVRATLVAGSMVLSTAGVALHSATRAALMVT